ncbi:bifunctional UDP-N-acetylmuramoyl-L-alanyl-D-glutamate--2,6-diaminopimelate ligase MurE/UDP-N-acetylmuramoyl-tripeptide--D-alanyl-D-alanine ligase MurF [Pusillimonas noertemannii]|uniref:Multifunctional fusion protein n=1 Tax=Pusillimonas noertemannii TaxID=305977 RepID=A0A2U1CKL3_9BURK|nr:bifunctional UDP-N-acetylmuramoyl-L-alanyl-D-glutamate--2,6-diaminopimelate ligase MurE/UDP-N-acetylmuramoyl-tripeptide--D-alanyl-D-alanine ligase MurF [Pusillimonas noertemannii]NYT69058.1 bifunctional UDP-N-acetylmuramoyl-L-alanyl-D-glutamate--2,6-diaminopimelate ligase MurE/UDP-N-acetylmuramoyl-tripeptide--D-alanyl-D-alanine ligase MurF [Pusillimonas noertemannii]PVY61525.1 UDP-N-acetylmuramoylalanyl-D-glutamate--2,6-diaminopimelate ligase /UDP-N-acetylmuramoyl-tripeptide--D-alanyl-D-alanin
MNTPQLIAWIEGHAPRGAHLCLDSRSIRRGDVFFACPGLKSDGRDYVEQAIANGAAAVLVQAGGATARIAEGAPVIEVEGLAGKLGELAHEWYGRPSEALSVVAITGTNGKTSSVQWMAAALNAEGVPCGTIGTLGVTLPDGTNLGGALTTPDVLTMHRSLAAIRDAGATVAAIEASSIGLDQGRLDAVHIRIAGFTNLTHDHLDYHHTIERYKAAKFALFHRPGLGGAVVNIDDPVGRELALQVEGMSLDTYSLGQDTSASIQAGDVHTGTYGLVFNLSIAQRTAQIVTRLVGLHNVSNLLLIAGVLGQLGWSVSRIARALSALRSVGGRLQLVEALDCPAAESGASEPMVVVDYAHTPDALHRALEALRETAGSRGGRLICVFGCGGDRDKSKRPVMGRLADQLADMVILTNDNPRSEDPKAILDDILRGMPGRPLVEPDRAAAILQAVWRAEPADVVLLAGKGHETYQEIAGQRSAFDDREWSRLALTWRRGASLSSDSRRIAQGQIFLALAGERFDGHAYLEQVREAGACAAIVARRNPDVDLSQFEVGDTAHALRLLGSQWRRCFDIPAIAVTGSNGKTTTKEMVASILRAWVGPENALWTRGNLNNELGVPLTLLELKPAHQAAVFELGMNHPGEIALLADMARPTVALVNNAQREHQEFMHTVEAVARENGSVFGALPEDGVAVFPGDDLYTGLWRELSAGRRTLVFGLEASFDVYADEIRAEPARTGFRLNTPGGAAFVQLGAPGVHNLRNALAAAACALAAGAPLAAIVNGLQGFDPVAGRMQPRALPGGLQLIDDTYNANPDSVRAAIDVLAQLQGRKVLVLGDMAEVGSDGPAMHAEVGAYAKEQGIDALLTFGPAARQCAQAFGANAHSFDDIEALLERLAGLSPANILVKGSRSTRMERVVQGFTQRLQAQAEGDHNVA